MAFSRPLYFVALIPQEHIKEEVLRLKLEIKEKYKAAHALKLPAHITLLPPFHLEETKEPHLKEVLTAVASKQEDIPINLKDFGRFGQRVIFINVEDPELIRKFHNLLLKSVEALLPDLSGGTLHPHITLATRDLTRENFQKAWKEYSSFSYSNSFTASSLYLMKHNGKNWDIHKEFGFMGNLKKMKKIINKNQEN